MKLYYHPASCPSRMVTMFAAEAGIELDLQVVDLFTGENTSETYKAMNPNGLVPVLEDGDFRLTESAAILRYLAGKSGSPAYPADLQARAGVDEAIDWFKSQFAFSFGYGYVYPQVIGDHCAPTAAAPGALAWNRHQTERWLDVLDRHMLEDGRAFVCGEEITLADYVGAMNVALGDLVGFELSRWPNVQRWMARMAARPAWDEVNAAFYGWVSALRPNARRTA